MATPSVAQDDSSATREGGRESERNVEEAE